MNRRLHVRDEAELDVIDAVAWYEDQRSGLGGEFLIELDAGMQRIVHTPLQFPVVRDSVRRALLHRFPYSVYFLVSDDMVDVVAVLHQHRNPRTWEERNAE